MVEANAGAGATTTGATEANVLSSAALEADLEQRVVRLEQLVAGFEQVLERFRAAGASFGATVFENFDDPGVSNDALDLLFASSTDARRDLAVLRRDAPSLVTASGVSAGHPLVVRLALLGKSAAELAARFEQYGRSVSLAVPPRTPGGVGRLTEFVGLIVRALREIADAMAGLRWDLGRLGFTANVVTQPSKPLTRPPEPRRSLVGALGMPLAGALWTVLRRRRTRLMIEFGGVVLVGVVILVSALGRGGRAPGLIADPGSASVQPSGTGSPGVAVGGSPGWSPSPGASTAAVASGPPPTQGAPSAAPTPTARGSAPRPTHLPAPTLEPAAAATRFSNRIGTAASSIDGLLGTITTAVQDADLPIAAAAAQHITSKASSERSWLLAHPAAACYRSFQESALTGYGELIVTAAAIVQDANAGNANAVHKDVAGSQSDIAMLKQAGNKAVAACA